MHLLSLTNRQDNQIKNWHQIQNTIGFKAHVTRKWVKLTSSLSQTYTQLQADVERVQQSINENEAGEKRLRDEFDERENQRGKEYEETIKRLKKEYDEEGDRRKKVFDEELDQLKKAGCLDEYSSNLMLVIIEPPITKQETESGCVRGRKAGIYPIHV
jgi:predicted nuclease with TOPRIM domain